MAQKYLFFDSTEEDPREYPAADFAAYFSKMLTNGIYNGGTNLQVTCTGSDINTKIQVGWAWINGYAYTIYDSPETLTHDLPHPTNDRIDRVVVRLDTTLANRFIKVFILKGTPAASPTPPALTRNSNIYELSLAQVRIIAGKSYIEAFQITDERLNNTVCGLVNSLIQADTTTIFNQFQNWYNSKTTEYQAAWNTWLTNNTTPHENAWTNWFNTSTTQFIQQWNNWFSGQQSGAYAPATDFNTHVADYVRQPGYGAATGSANTYAITLNPAPSAYVDGMGISIKINTNNTGASTVNINGLGAKAIKKANGNDVAAGNLKAGSIYTFKYNGTNFILQGEGGDDNLIPGNIKTGITISDVTGTFTSDANATAADLANGKTAYVNGNKVTGTSTKKYGIGDTISMANLAGVDTMFTINHSWLSCGNSNTIVHVMAGGFFYIYWLDAGYTTWNFKKIDYAGNILATFTIPAKNDGLLFDYYGYIFTASRNSSDGVWTHSKYSSTGSVIWADKTIQGSYGGTGFSAWRSVAWDGSSLQFYYQSNSTTATCSMSKADASGNTVSTYLDVGMLPALYYPFPMHCSDGSFFYTQYSGGTYYFRHRNLNGTERKVFDMAGGSSPIYCDGTTMTVYTGSWVKSFSISSTNSYTYLWTANNYANATAVNGYGWCTGVQNNNYFVKKFSLSNGIAVSSSELYHGFGNNLYTYGSHNANYSVLTNGNDMLIRDIRDGNNIALVSKNTTILS